MRQNAQRNNPLNAAEKREQTAQINHTLRYLFNSMSIVNANDELLAILDDITDYALILNRGGLSAATNRIGYGWTS